MIFQRQIFHRPSVIGECNCCGQCCQKLILLDDRKPIKSRAEFTQLLKSYPEYKVFEPLDEFSAQGDLYFSCSWLDETNHCSHYERRPKICRTYPFRKLKLMGGQLPEKCSYQIVSQHPFQQVLKREKGKIHKKNLIKKIIKKLKLLFNLPVR